MPFAKQQPRPFTIDDIQKIASDQNGVYGIFREDTWIYIGKGDIQERLFGHVKG